MLRQAQHRRVAALALALASIAVPVSARAPASPAVSTRAMAAGYKALMLCGVVFNAGRTAEQADKLELIGTYPEYDALLPTLKATVDAESHNVDVRFDPKIPPRSAYWDSINGCTILPVGSESGSVVEDEITADGKVIPPRTGPVGPDRRVWPLGDAGITPTPNANVEAAIANAFPATGPRTTGIVVVADGKIIAERYADGFEPFTANRTWSVAKSITGTLIGAAIQQRAIRTTAPATIPEWPKGDPRRAITLDHLLHMASGLHSDTAGNRTDAVYFGGVAVTEETVAWPLGAKPGTRFRYANNDILLAMRSLRASLGDERYVGFPHDSLFGPLGMRHTVAERDWAGNYVLSSQVWSTARDLVRFGQLYLDDGVANGRRILPQGWVKYVTTPSGPQPTGAFGYGATFWLLNKSPGVPADTFGAFGNRGQYVIIVPSRRVVIVRRGEDPTGAKFDIARFTADILAALK